VLLWGGVCVFGIVATGSGFSGCSFLLSPPAFFKKQTPPFWQQKGGVFGVQKYGF